jgi:uncharacterized protein (TIGR00299 family) protein
MKTLYLDIFSGISGDMLIGALIDLGVDARRLEREIGKLGLEGYHLHVARGKKASIEGVKFDVHLAHEHGHEHSHTHADGTGHTHSHSPTHPLTHSPGPHGGPLLKTRTGQVELSVFETDVPPRFRLYFYDRKGRPVPPLAPKGVRLETARPDGARQVFKFKRHKDCLEATEELPEPHEFTAILGFQRRAATEEIETSFVEEHHHGHDHSYAHTHSHSPTHSLTHSHAANRTFTAIKRLIVGSKLSAWVQQKSVAIFHRIAVAEGKIHGLPPEQVHFHEVGAVDSIVDIVGACIGLELLGKPRVLAGSVIEGAGWINCAHGRFPIPAPATLAILGARGIALSQCEEPHELVTPTGAALLAELAETFGPMRNLVAEKIGFGLGTRDNQTRPNVLRAVLGESSVEGRSSVKSTAEDKGHDWEIDRVTVLETNLDDINAEILGNFVDQALAAGALDVFHTPIQMKKNRPGVLLTVLCAEAEADRFSELMLLETSTFGIRRYIAERRKLAREFKTIETPHGKVTVKLGRLDGRTVQAAPEYESCRKLAEKTKVPLKQIYAAANKAIEAGL